MAGNPTLPKENIDEVILGLLALEPNEIDELDYQTYRSYLKEFLVEISSGKKIDSGEAELIQKEFKRVKGKTGRFKISAKKSKVTATGLGLGGVRKQVRGAQQRLMLAPVGGVPKEKPEILKGKGSESDVLSRISNTLDSIFKTLTDINKENRKRSDRERRDAEGKRRSGKEREFESKLFDGVKNSVKAILKPFESIWDRIVRFITMILLGRALIKLLDWFADPNNQGKIQSIIRFFKDHWPTLLALYLRFGTGIGRFVGKLSSVLIKGAIKLGALAAKLAVKAGLKGFGGAARFLGGAKGKALGTALSIGADVAITAGTAAGIGGLASGDIKVPGFSGGGFSGGIKNFFGNMFSGLVKGPKGRDKVPAMLTDGEFVMSAGAVRKYGVDTLESMNAAGGGTNIPQVADGMTFAFGGGFVGDEDLRRMAAGASSPTGGVAGSREYVYDPNNSDHINNYEKLKKIATKKGVYKPPTGVKSNTYTSPNVKTNVDVNVDAKPSTSITRPMQQGSSRGGALSTNVKIPRPRVRGYGGALQAAFAAMEFNDRKQAGQTNAQAGLGAAGSTLGGSIGWMAGAKAGALIGGGIGALFGGVGAAPGAAVGAIIGGLAGGFGGASLGGKFADDLSGVNAIKERMGRGGVGGAIKGGYGLKDQSFKDAPKTQIMSDDKGRPFVGYKAMRGGKTVYVRGPQAGTGTSNPLEALGRMINPGAYKDIDAANARKKYDEAARGSISSLRARGASQATIAKRQTELKKGVKPLPRRRTKADVIGSGMGGRRGSVSNPSNGQKPRSQNPTHSAKSTRTARSTLGVNKK